MDFIKHNEIAWDQYSDKKNRWTIPVEDQLINNAKQGNWKVTLTPTKAVPKTWFPDLSKAKILGLASGGGQQGPILAAAGADVTIFDNSKKQLEKDSALSEQFNLNIKTIQGDMRDLSMFSDNFFDLVFNPCSVMFVDDVKQVWKECYRVLKPNGILMTGFINPIAFQITLKDMKLAFKQPFSDLQSLPPAELNELKKNNEGLIFGHSLTDQIGGQLELGFVLTDMYEDIWDEMIILDHYFPSLIATRSVKSN